MIRLLVVLALALPPGGEAVALSLQAAAVQQQRPPEEVKAGLLYAFARKTTWPDKALPKAGPFVLGVMGPPKVTATLHEVLKDKTIQGRPIKIQVVDRAEALAGVHLAYLADSGDGQLAEDAKTLLRSAQGTPTLTLSELPGFASDGGILNFYTESVNGSDRMRFEINPKAAERSGLNVTELIPIAPRVIK